MTLLLAGQITASLRLFAQERSNKRPALPLICGPDEGLRGIASRPVRYGTVRYETPSRHHDYPTVTDCSRIVYLQQGFKVALNFCDEM